MLQHRATLLSLCAMTTLCACRNTHHGAGQQPDTAHAPQAGKQGTPAGMSGPAADGGSTAQADGGSPRTPQPHPSAGASAQAGSMAMMHAGAGGKPATPPKLPDGAVSKPGTYTGFGDKLYSTYKISSLYVPVRDGTQLAVDLYRPQDPSGKAVETPLPVLFMYTPYNRRYFPAGGTGDGTSGDSYPGVAARLVAYGYVVAIADFRGVYASYGKNAGYNRGEWVDDARMDSYDVVEWLAKQPWSTGKIGMWGCSATGGSQLQAAITAPPHLKAIFPMSCEFDAYPFGVPGGMSASQGDTKAPPGGGSAAHNCGGRRRRHRRRAAEGGNGRARGRDREPWLHSLSRQRRAQHPRPVVAAIESAHLPGHDQSRRHPAVRRSQLG